MLNPLDSELWSNRVVLLLEFLLGNIFFFLNFFTFFIGIYNQISHIFLDCFTFFGLHGLFGIFELILISLDLLFILRFVDFWDLFSQNK